jgi:putative methylase
VDTVLTNPPFGTKHNAGIDVQFLRTGTRLARRSVYSFHKTSTREYLLKKVAEWGMEATVVAEMKFELSNTYKFHQKKSVDIEVDLMRVSIPQRLQEDDCM